MNEESSLWDSTAVKLSASVINFTVAGHFIFAKHSYYVTTLKSHNAVIAQTMSFTARLVLKWEVAELGLVASPGPFAPSASSLFLSPPYRLLMLIPFSLMA